MIITANTWFNNPPHNVNTFEGWKLKMVIPSMVRSGIKIVPKVTGDPLTAEVNAGRWIVKCECGGGEYAWEENLFMCLSCFNASNGHNFRPVVFPKERKQIEEILEPRLQPRRNWSIGETVEFLKEENEFYKSELLEVS